MTAALLLTVCGAMTLSACGAPGPAPDSPQGRCAAAADADPDVRAEQQKMVAIRVQSPQSVIGQEASLRQQKINTCLRAQGLGPPGGVEKVR